MKVALVYDRINKWGGAERVLLALHSIFPDAPLYTSVYNPDKAPWAHVFEIHTSFLQQFPFASSMHEMYGGLMPLAFENFVFDQYDVVISVTSEAAKGILTKPGTLHVSYCLTPTRYLWSGYDEYFANPVLRLASGPVVSYLRSWDRVAAWRPDAYVAISQEVKKRIKKYYGRESEIIYPPLMLSSVGKEKKQEKTEDFFLVVSRLVPYKRIDVAIAAFNMLKWPLKIVGTGYEEAKLRSMAGPTIEFLGNLTDEKLLRYYKKSLGLVFPGKEDFGLVLVEAQSQGKPVIAYKEGGAVEVVVEGKTGLFFSPQQPKALVDTLLRFQRMAFRPEEARKQAQRFALERFRAQFLEMLTRLQGQKKNTL